MQFKVTLSLLLLLCCTLTQAQSYNYYFGNIHAHTAYSDGSKDGQTSKVTTPAQAFQYAKKSQHLDFLGISEHNHAGAKMKLANYAKGLAQADSTNEDGRFVCLYGMEYGLYKGGHVLIYGMDQLIGWEDGNYNVFSAKNDYESLFGLLAQQPGVFATLAHPGKDHFNNLIGRPYDLKADQAICGVAISNGPHTSKDTTYMDKAKISYLAYYKKLLAAGYIVGPTMDHDNHNTTFGRTASTRTAVLAQTLNRDSIIEAYRANRFYATEDWNARLNFRINNQPLGSYIKDRSDLNISIHVDDPDTTDGIEKINLYYGKPGSGQQATVLSTSKLNHLASTFSLKKKEAYYFFVEVIQHDGDRIYSSPIWAKN